PMSRATQIHFTLVKASYVGLRLAGHRRLLTTLRRTNEFSVWTDNCIACHIMYSVRSPKATRLHHYGPSSHRYPIRAALEYRLVGHDRFLKTGTGSTILLSSRSLLIESETSLPPHRRLDLWIEWPVRLENTVGLRLHIEGRTVSSAGTATEVEIIAYEFRTCSLQPQTINDARDGGAHLKSPRLRLWSSPSSSPSPVKTNRPRLIQLESFR